MRNLGFMICGLFFFSGLAGCQKAEKREEKYPNGKLKKRWFIEKDKSGKYVKHGKETKWFDDGKMEESASYKSGKVEGKHVLYVKQKTLLGKPSKSYLKVISPYRKGKLHGKVLIRELKTYDSKGYIKGEIDYVKGKKHGFDRYWSYVTKKNQEYLMRSAKFKVKIGRHLMRETPYKHGKKHGTERRWFSFKLSSTTQYLNGKLHGKKIKWGNKGKKTLEETYTNGRLVSFKNFDRAKITKALDRIRNLLHSLSSSCEGTKSKVRRLFRRKLRNPAKVWEEPSKVPGGSRYMMTILRYRMSVLPKFNALKKMGDTNYKYKLFSIKCTDAVKSAVEKARKRCFFNGSKVDTSWIKSIGNTKCF